MSAPTHSETPLKVVIAMSGGIDSTVAAYLLKKQKYDCVGVTIDFFVKGLENLAKTNFPNFMLTDMSQVQRSCEKLGIPFYAVNAQSEFEDEILDMMVSNKLSGHEYNMQAALTRKMFEILWNKAQVLGANYVATGHYVRLHSDKINNTITLNRSNFPENDQCYLLSRVNPEIFRHLMIPLSELRKDDVRRLGQKLGLDYRSETKPVDKLQRHLAQSAIVQEIVAKNLRPEGVLMHERTDRHLGDHKGVHTVYMGMDNVASSSQLHTVDRELEVVRIDARRSHIFLLEPGTRVFPAAFIHRLQLNQGTDITHPIQVYAQIEDHLELHSCLLCFKNNQHANIYFKEPVKDLVRGQLVSLFASSRGGAKLVGSGYIAYIGNFERIHRGEMAEDDELSKRKDEDKKKKIKKELFF